MNKFAPKSDFLKQRAISLHKSGYSPSDISRMLKVSEDTSKRWVKPEFGERRYLMKAMARAEREAAKLEAPSILPTLAFVPHIELTKNSKYQMRAG